MDSVLTLIRAVVFASLFTIAAPAIAADANIGFINIARLLEEAPQAQSANQELQQEFGPQQRELATKAKDLQDLEERLSRDSAIMSESERQDAERRYRELQREINRRRTEISEDYNIRRNEELAKLQRIVLKEVQEFAREQNIDLVFGDAIYASSAVDITDDMLRRLESQFREQAGGQ